MKQLKTTKVLTPLERLKSVMEVARFCSRAVGANLFDPDYRINFLTIILLSFIVLYFVFNIMTIIEMYKDDWKIILQGSCMTGSVLQGAVKLASVFFYRKDMVNLRLLFENIYEEYQQKGEAYCEALDRCNRKVRFAIKVVGAMYVVSIVGIIIVPLIYLLFGKRYMMIHFKIPFIDPDKTEGYFITLVLHIFCILAGGFGLFSGDLFTLIYITQSFVFVDIFQLKIKHLKKLSEHTASQTAEDNMQKSLIEIVKWHQGFLSFTEKCNVMFFYIVTVQIFTSFLSTVLTIFVILTMNWPIAYSYLVLSICNLYTYCVLGTKIEKCNEDFCFAIYNICWYNLIAPQQKVVVLMLMQAQNAKPIEIAGCYPLAVSTALQLTKAIYTISMMMFNFLYGEE